MSEEQGIEVCENDHLVLISGASSTGKSASLMGLKNQDGVLYLNCENNKKLPFKNSFEKVNITDPMDVYEAFEYAEEEDSGIHTIVIDTFTYLMDMYESEYVLKSTNTMQAWGEYAQYAKRLFSQYIAKSTKNVIILAHTSNVVNDDQITETCVQVKGSLMKTGVESFFSNVISTKKVPLKKIEKAKCESDYLNITEDDEDVGIKYVFQTKLTKETVNERMRAPLGMWSRKEVFIDNNLQNVIDRLREYYADEE